MPQTPDLMPVLTTGRHRNPRKGACFMEMASYLAGERWSDHPACTHPLVAAVAREVNDRVSNAARSRIAPLIPDVVGLVSEDPRADLWICREVALAALPVAPAGRQRVLAVGLLTAERLLNAHEGRPTDAISDDSRRGLEAVPDAYGWALRTFGRTHGSLRSFRRGGAPTVVHAAVGGIADAAIRDPDDRLVALLERLIVLCRDWFAVQAPTPVMIIPEQLRTS